MKKTFTLLATLFLVTGLSAQVKLSITNSGNSAIRVMVDGKKYSGNNNLVMINNLNSGNHVVKIFRQVNERNRGNGNNNRNAGYQLLYSKNVFVKAQHHVDITINRFGKVFVDEQLISGGYGDDDDDDWGVDDNDRYYDRYSRSAMDNSTFEQLKQTLKRESFDDNRMKIARQVIGVNFVNTAQVKEMMGLFSFEKNRLEIAKFAYDYTTDKGNYFILYDAFSFSSSKEELMNYIQNRK